VAKSDRQIQSAGVPDEGIRCRIPGNSTLLPDAPKNHPITGMGAIASRRSRHGYRQRRWLDASSDMARNVPVASSLCVWLASNSVASQRGVCKMQASFTVISGPHHGQTFQVPRGKFIIGRETDCHLLLASNSVSRHHCVLLMDEYTLRIRDLASKNGTFINRDQTRIGERILVHGDTVYIGDMVIRIELESGTASASLETRDVEPETIDHTGHSLEKPKVNQPKSAEAPKSARE
jgi:Inner membrane component of T3SS, cytoplasmic domain